MIKKALVWLSILYTIYNLLQKARKINYNKIVFSTAKQLPFVRNKIDKKMNEIKMGMLLELIKNFDQLTHFESLPKKGIESNEIINGLEEQKQLLKIEWTGLSGTIYHNIESLNKLHNKIYKMFKTTNLLHSDVFPLVRKLEAEVIRMTLSMFNGDNDSCGVITSGGTESIFLACLAYRERAYKKGIKNPEIIIPVSAHSAFVKAGKILNMKVIKTKLNKDYIADIDDMEKHINKNTVLLVGSVPNYPYGTIDNIVEISDLAKKNNIKNDKIDNHAILMQELKVNSFKKVMGI